MIYYAPTIFGQLGLSGNTVRGEAVPPWLRIC
jgi:hypothetical protein